MNVLLRMTWQVWMCLTGSHSSLAKCFVRRKQGPGKPGPHTVTRHGTSQSNGRVSICMPFLTSLINAVSVFLKLMAAST